MNQSSCCGDSEFMDAAYCYYYPNRRCFKSDCGACPYTASVLNQDVEDCFCNSSCVPDCSESGNSCSCCCAIPSMGEESQTESQDANGCAGIACKTDSCGSTRRLCCDRDGTCCLYPEQCRNRFWPEFSHPRWLGCKDLYNGQNNYDSCCDCGCETSQN